MTDNDIINSIIRQYAKDIDHYYSLKESIILHFEGKLTYHQLSTTTQLILRDWEYQMMESMENIYNE